MSVPSLTTEIYVPDLSVSGSFDPYRYICGLPVFFILIWPLRPVPEKVVVGCPLKVKLFKAAVRVLVAEPVPRLKSAPEAEISPATSSLVEGEVLPMPTLPPLPKTVNLGKLFEYNCVLPVPTVPILRLVFAVVDVHNICSAVETASLKTLLPV